MNPDFYISLLLEKAQEEKTLKRWCKSNTVFRLPQDKKGTFRKIKVPFTPAVKTALFAEFKNQIEFINDGF